MVARKSRGTNSLSLRWKCVGPVCCLLTLVVVLVAAFVSASDRTSSRLAALLFGVVFLFSLLYASWIKFVSMDEDFMYASSLRKTIKIPLSEIDSVSESHFGTPKRIRIRLKRPSEFGESISFIKISQKTSPFMAGMNA
jgi:hypothetical protein